MMYSPVISFMFLDAGREDPIMSVCAGLIITVWMSGATLAVAVLAMPTRESD
jgi:hypothetical protein